MKSYKLSFGTVVIINSNLAEVIIDEGIEMDGAKVDEYHDFLLNNLDDSFSLLINKKYSYSYMYTAQKTIGNLMQINAMAVVINSNGGLMSSETLIDMNKAENWNIKLFRNRDEALVWLASQ